MKEELLKLFNDCDHIEIDRDDNDFRITIGSMYNPPKLNFSTLTSLSRLFGTEEIDVNEYSQGGCDSCDWGSDYGHTIDVLNPTKNVDEAKAILGKLKGK